MCQTFKPVLVHWKVMEGKCIVLESNLVGVRLNLKVCHIGQIVGAWLDYRDGHRPM